MCIVKINLTRVYRVDRKEMIVDARESLKQVNLKNLFRAYYVPEPEHCEGQVRRAGEGSQ